MEQFEATGVRRISIRLQFCSGGRTAGRIASANASEAHRRNRFASCGKLDASTRLIASSMMNRRKRPAAEVCNRDVGLFGNSTNIANRYCYCNGAYFLPEKRNGSRRKNFSHFQ